MKKVPYVSAVYSDSCESTVIVEKYMYDVDSDTSTVKMFNVQAESSYTMSLDDFNEIYKLRLYSLTDKHTLSLVNNMKIGIEEMDLRIEQISKLVNICDILNVRILELDLNDCNHFAKISHNDVEFEGSVEEVIEFMYNNKHAF